ncbi:MAG: sulfotransferase [Myxococcota bacterium]|nr:sulfotransferase [Myxococcota bacterium]
MRFHFDFANWARMVRLAAGEKQWIVRLYFLSILLVWIPLASSFHALCFFLDGILFPALHRVRVEAPVFVLGHARSGTTLVHRLMSEDEARFSAFRLYELYFPSLLQKKAIRFVMRLDARLLGGALERRIRQWEDRHYARTRQVHAMGLTEYEEDDIVLYYSCASGYWVTKLPYMGELDFYAVDEWPEAKRRRLMRFYADCVKRQLLLNGTDKTHLSKNPIFAGRVAALIETFPDARIVVPLRDPRETIPSLLKLVRGGWKRLGWDEQRQQRGLAALAAQSFHTYRHPLEVLERHPETPRALVDYRELVADPAGSIEAIYSALGLSLSERHRASLARRGGEERGHRTRHRYSLEEFGLSADAIRQELPELFESMGWDDEEAAPSVPSG